jgi:serine protease AprX
MNTGRLVRRRSVALGLVAVLGLTAGRLVGAVTTDGNEVPPPGSDNLADPLAGAKLSPALQALAANGGGGGEGGLAEFDPGEVDVIVSFQSKPAAGNEAITAQVGAQPNRVYQSLPFKAMRVPVDQLYTLAADSSVSFVSADDYVQAAAQSGLQTARVPGSSSALATPNTAYQGSGVAVAVLDTGVFLHGDFLRTPVWQHDFVNGAGGVATAPSDPYGHGTHVAGMVGGDGYYSPGAKYQGVSTRASVISLRVLDGEGRGRLSDVLAALDWILYPGRTQYNIRVANLSFGKGVEGPQALDPLVQAVNAVWDAGVVVVVSAGNFGESGHYTVSSPGNSRKVITVGSLTDRATGSHFGDDYVSSYSSRGPTLYDHVLKPDLVAPGNRVVAPYASGSRLGQLVPGDRVFCGASGTSCSWRYLRLSGSSMAAAMVSGAAARMLEKDPTLSPSTVKARLMKSARKIYGDPTRTGAGVLDVEGAMNAGGVMSTQALSPLLGLSASGTAVVYVQDTAHLWSGSQWGVGYIWRDGYLWSSGGPLAVTGYLWSNGSLWSDSSLWADGYLWSNGFLWSQAVVPASADVEDPDEVIE